MKFFDNEEIRLHDEVAARVLAALVPSLPSPSAAASAMPVVFELAEVFVRERRRRLEQPEGVEQPIPALLVKS